jgi:hypothetical protein
MATELAGRPLRGQTLPAQHLVRLDDEQVEVAESGWVGQEPRVGGEGVGRTPTTAALRDDDTSATRSPQDSGILGTAACGCDGALRLPPRAPTKDLTNLRPTQASNPRTSDPSAISGSRSVALGMFTGVAPGEADCLELLLITAEPVTTSHMLNSIGRQIGDGRATPSPHRSAAKPRLTLSTTTTP